MAKKNLIPKKIAGFKVPKALRKSKLLSSLLHSDVGRAIVANALTAGAAAAAQVLVRERDEIASAARAGKSRGSRAASLVGEAFSDAAHAVMGVVADAAESALPKDKRRKGQDRPGRERYN